jgi:hypothetical protein
MRTGLTIGEFGTALASQEMTGPPGGMYDVHRGARPGR